MRGARYEERLYLSYPAGGYPRVRKESGVYRADEASSKLSTICTAEEKNGTIEGPSLSVRQNHGEGHKYRQRTERRIPKRLENTLEVCSIQEKKPYQGTRTEP